MPAPPRFHAALAACSGIRLAVECFRVVALSDLLKTGTTPTLLFDLGPRISRGGQRFSPPDDHRGLYVSQEAATAGAEFAHGMQASKSGTCAGHARFGMEVKLASVLDLTCAATRRTLKTSIKELHSPWEEYAANHGGAWPATWQLRHEAFASGKFDAIRFPSYRRPAAGSCLLIFTERLVAGSTHVIIHRTDGSEWERLP